MRDIKCCILFMLLLLPAALLAQDATIKASAKSVVEVGEQFQVVFDINAKVSDFKAPAFNGFDVIGGPFTSSSTSINMVNGNVNKVVSNKYTYVLKAYKEGDFNSDEFLKENLVYPVKAYKKYNGFLGILGYTDDGLLFCSKSRIDGDFADYFKTIFRSYGYDEVKLFDYMRKNNVGLIFEVIDPIHDPHIVQYDKSDIILLDVVTL